MTRTKAARLSNWVPVKVGCETVPAGVPALTLVVAPVAEPVASAISALVFGALDYGTTRGLDPEVFDPGLAGNLSMMIQGLVVLFVGADLLILWLWNLRRKRFKAPRIAGRGA